MAASIAVAASRSAVRPTGCRSKISPGCGPPSRRSAGDAVNAADYLDRFKTLRGSPLGETIELRWDPNEPDVLPQVWRDGAVVCGTVELDLLANASRKRKVIQPPPTPELEPTGIDVLGDLEREHYGRGLADDGDQQ